MDAVWDREKEVYEITLSVEEIAVVKVALAFTTEKDLLYAFDNLHTVPVKEKINA